MPHPYNNAPQQHPGATTYPRPRRRVWPWLLGGLLVLVVCGGAVIAGIGADGNAGNGDPLAGDRLAVDRTGTSTPAAPTGKAPASAKASKPAGLPRTFAGSGSYEVGRDIAPGRYKTAGPPADAAVKLCTWQITTSAGAFVDGGVSQGPVYLPTASGKKLTAGQVVEVTGCDTWSTV